jgi:hypothetical protein
VNSGFGIPTGLMLGLILIIGGLTLFFLGNIKPDIKRDSDNIYAIIAIVTGVLSVINFTKGFVESFEQLLLVGSLVTLMWQNIQSRTPNPDAKKGSFMGGGRDDDRPRRPYRAERANEYEEFGSSWNGGAGLEGGRRSGNSASYDSGGYGAGSDYGDKRLPKRDREDDRSSRRPSNYSDDSWDNDRGNYGRNAEAPRSIPSKSSRPARERDNESDDRGFEADRPRRRRSSEGREDREGRNMNDRPVNDRDGRDGGGRNRDEAARPRRRSSQVEDVRGESEEIPTADYVEYKPLDIKPDKPSGSGWGPQE